jgi:hypothetical protein
LAHIDSSRRAILALAFAVAGAAALSPRRSGAAPDAAAATHLDVKDPAAAALGYVEDAARAEAVKSPGFIAGSNCENCLQLQGRAGDAYRPCSLFPGKLVSAAGWCSSWTPEI